MGAAGAEQSASVESERGGAGGELVRRCRVLCGSAAVGVLRVVLGQCGHRSAAGEYMRCGCGTGEGGGRGTAGSEYVWCRVQEFTFKSVCDRRV